MISKKYGIVSSKHSIMIGCSLIIFAISFLAGCWGSQQKSQESGLVVINVLDASYYDDCHITGSINIPFEQFEDQLKTFSKNNEYVIYCSTYACTAAPYSAQMMKDNGFSQVSVLPGGIVEWYQKGLPYQGPARLQYLQEENQKPEFDTHEGVAQVSPDELLEKLKAAKLV